MNLWITDFRSIHQISLQIPVGVSSLMGKSGSGKTTLITALCWILYGSGGSGPHRAVKIQTSTGNSATGVLALKVPDGYLHVLRISPGKRNLNVPSWIPAELGHLIRNYVSNTIGEMMWLNGNPVNFEFFRDKIFGTYMTFSSIAIVPQKLPSPLLVTGKLSQTIQELFFPTSGPSCPDTYLTRIKEEIKKTEDYVKRVDTQLKFLNEQSGQLKVRRFNAAKSITESTDKEEIEAHINDILTRISKHVAIVSGAQVVADLNQKHHEENKQFTNWKCREALAIDARKNIPNSTAAKLTLDDARDKLTAVIGDVNFDEFITDQIRKSKIYIIEKELEDLANKPTTYPDREYVQNALSIDSKYKEQCRAVNIQPYPLATISLRALEALKTEIINLQKQPDLTI